MSTQEPGELRPLLRRLPALAGPFPVLDPADLPDRPDALFVRWLHEAVDAGVREPHAMTVATADGAGRPSARVVILKDLVDGGWQFATDARSRKATDLEANPAASVSFYWREQGRQVRLDGTARALGPEASAADFLARSPASRAAALATRPGEPLPSTADLQEAMAGALARVEQDPGTVLAEWVLYSVVPHTVEFWQGDPRRAHTRVVYRRGAPGGGAVGAGDSAGSTSAGWSRELVWP
ncbi:pyridoxine/pyridoxamine 5'-phosphate oxidase [Cellulomonas aerilata]|uniref:Pyridoxamine 5'-phosphate oxidase n=1 Tax=Cellulomonas aerilata TaxID=515326 RepID=A0A512DGX0_9CELL|nr:pyridoxal 5'-phosphate synthase [Cellulomonas aerilata]GEO35737.1 pyridoxamine 5'-phosphate oxidase [Cellulomonas aerilata]